MKKFFRIAAALSLTGLLLSGCGAGGSSDKNLTPLVLNEVAHSIFYAPQYAAIELGYFEEEGIKVELSNGGGADKCMTAVLSGQADIGVHGPEAVIYVAVEKDQDYPIMFGQLTEKDGSFLMASAPMPDFKWTDMAGTRTICWARARGAGLA